MNTNNSAIEESRSWVAHPNGIFQPGILVLSKQGRVLYRWRSHPSRENLGGAIMRPTAEYVWEQIQLQLKDPSDDQAVDKQTDAALDDAPKLDAKPISWTLFMLLLLAHGWFLGPKVFPDRRGDEKMYTPNQMWPRFGVFAAGVIAAFVLLPTGWVVVGLVGWGAFVWPKIAKYNREFQNVTEQ